MIIEAGTQHGRQTGGLRQTAADLGERQYLGHAVPPSPVSQATPGVARSSVRSMIRSYPNGLSPRESDTHLLLSQVRARVGMKWEPPALTAAFQGCDVLSCGRLDLGEHGDDQVQKGWVHSWGSRGRGFKSRRPDSYCRSEATSPAR